MILHIVLRRMSQNHRRFDLANYRRQTPQQVQSIKNLQVIGKIPVKMSTQYFRGVAGLRIANRPGRRPVVFSAAAIPAGKVQVVRFKPGLFEQEESARHVELDVVGMRSNGDGCLYRHVYNFTGFPVAADRSAAKRTSCVLAASAKLVNGISLFLSKASKKASNCV